MHGASFPVKLHAQIRTHSKLSLVGNARNGPEKVGGRRGLLLLCTLYVMLTMLPFSILSYSVQLQHDENSDTFSTCWFFVYLLLLQGVCFFFFWGGGGGF